MTRLSMDEAIAAYSEQTRGEFKANQLRRVVSVVKQSRRYAGGRFFDEGDLILTLVPDEGIFMKNVKVLTRFGVGSMRRVQLVMHTEVVADATES